ncbi:MAG: hypothetical protein R3F19_25715 [Verrucomicrobiales bacterium]
MKTGIAIFVLAVLLCSAAIWMFGILMTTPTEKLNAEEAEAMRKEMDEAIGICSESEYYAVAAAVSEVHTRIAPFAWLPSFHLSPHRLPSVLGIIGSLLLVLAFAWCLFVPKVIAEESATTEDEMNTKAQPKKGQAEQ